MAVYARAGAPVGLEGGRGRRQGACAAVGRQSPGTGPRGHSPRALLPLPHATTKKSVSRQQRKLSQAMRIQCVEGSGRGTYRRAWARNTEDSGLEAKRVVKRRRRPEQGDKIWFGEPGARGQAARRGGGGKGRKEGDLWHGHEQHPA